MAKYTVYAHETVYQCCTVETDSPEEAMRLVDEGEFDGNWEIYDSDDFNIDSAELEKEQ